MSSQKVLRPMNSFMIYRVEKQQEVVKECPGANHRDISKIIAKWWRELPDKDKEPYRQRAELLKKEHRRLYPNYKFSPQRKSGKTRSYRKRTQSELTAADFETKKQLNAIYNRGRNCKDSNKMEIDQEDITICKTQAIANISYTDMFSLKHYDDSYLHLYSACSHSLSTSPVMSSYSLSSVNDDYGVDSNQVFELPVKTEHINCAYSESPQFYYDYRQENEKCTSKDESTGSLDYPQFSNIYIHSPWDSTETEVFPVCSFSSFLTQSLF